MSLQPLSRPRTFVGSTLKLAPSSAETEPEEPLPEMRATDDVAALRRDVYASVEQAAATMPPVVGPTHTLLVKDVHYAKDDPDFNLTDEKQAILKRGSLSRRLRGTWQLLDNATGSVVSERPATLANVPAILHDGTMIHRGTRYAMGYQQRLRPGAYVRRKSNGEYESHFNALQGKGVSHRYVLSPETGQFHVEVGHAKIPLLPLLDILGAKEEDIRGAWGDEIYSQNVQKNDTRIVPKLYERLVSPRVRKEAGSVTPEQMRTLIREALANTYLDPQVTRHTMGRSADHVDADLVLRATKEVLRLSKGERDPDDRDHLAYATFHSAPDIFAERFQNDYGRLRRDLLRKVVRKGNLESVPSSVLDRQIEAAIFRSGLAASVEEINPAEILSAITKVTRYGEGGLPGADQTPDESRNVSTGQFGFIDLLVTPECEPGDHEVLTRRGYVRWDQVQDDDEFAVWRGAAVEYVRASNVVRKHYVGKMIRVCSLGHMVTPSHRMYVRQPGDNDWQFVPIKDLNGSWIVPRSIAPEELNYLVDFDTKESVQYAGMVYCATVEGGLLYTRGPSESGTPLVGLLSGNSLRVGVDGYLAKNTFIGKDKQLYTKVLDRNGMEKIVSPSTLMSKTFSVGSSPIKGRETAVRNGKMLLVRPDEVDYRIPHAEDLFGHAAGLAPGKSAMYGQRASMASRMTGQALAIDNPEAPLVQTGVPGAEYDSYEAQVGSRMGAVFAEQPGRVLSVTPDFIEVKYQGGQTAKIALDNNRPGARKSIFHQESLVQAGQEFAPGQLLARSNYTDNEGVAAVGANLRVALMAMDDNFEDGVVISQSAANRMRVQQAYKFLIDKDSGKQVDRRKFLTTFGTRYDREQLDKLGPDGVVKVGQTVRKDDPLILAVKERDLTKGRVHRQGRSNFADASVRWDHNHEGIVTDVVFNNGTANVVVRTSKPMENGDKLAGRQGNKGVVSVLPDAKMPHDKDGNPIDMAISPLSVPSRGNSIFPIEMLLGKIAKKTGKPYRLVDFQDRDLAQFALDEAKKHGVDEKEDLFDPETGRKLSNVFTGQLFTMALSHTAEAKRSARGLGKYSADGSPARGKDDDAQAKRNSFQQMFAHLSHGAYDLSRETSMLRGKRNDDYWNAFMSGRQTQEPVVADRYVEFIDRLKASGINPVRRGSKTQLMSLTDKDVDDLAGSRRVTVPETVDLYKDLSPIDGGLFDRKIFGEGTRFAVIDLPEPMPNPAFEEPIRRLLGLTEKEYREILGGRAELNSFGSGPQAIRKSLASMDLDREIVKARQEIAGPLKTKREAAIRRIGYLQGLKKTDRKPEDLIITKVPVLPPRFRPVAELAGKGGVTVDDANYLYRELMLAGQGVAELSKRGVSDLHEERLSLYDAHKALVGLSDPVSRELQQRGVTGLLKTVLGKHSPKSGMLQRRLLSGNVDTIGRGTVMVDSSLGMDSIGLPESIAFKIFEPYIIRGLVQSGVPKQQSLEMVESRHSRARDVLVREMERRPVTMSRAPVLHKYGDMGFKAELIRGETIRVNPFVTVPMGMDFDGDRQIGHVIFRINSETEFGRLLATGYGTAIGSFNSLCELTMASITKSGLPCRRGDRYFVCDLEDFPHLERYKTTPGRCGDVEWYEVPDGVEVLSYDDITGEARWSAVSDWSKHHGCAVEIVNLKSGRQIFTDDDPRGVLACVPSYGTLAVNTYHPKALQGVAAFVPRMQRHTSTFESATATEVPTPSHCLDIDSLNVKFKLKPTIKLNSETGWLFGAICGDGWTSDERRKDSDGRVVSSATKQVYLVAAHEELFNQFKTAVEQLLEPVNGNQESAHFKSHVRDGDGTATGGYGRVERITISNTSLARLVRDWIGHRSEGKRLPPVFFTACEEFRHGLFAGLMDTDGCVTVTSSKKKKQLLCSYSTISLRLAREVALLAQSLGIRARVLFSKKSSVGNDLWMINFSTPDMKRWAVSNSNLMRNPVKRELLVETHVLAEDEGNVNPRFDKVPVTPKLAEAILAYVRSDKSLVAKQIREAVRHSRTTCTMTRTMAMKVVDYVPVEQVAHCEELDQWVQLVVNRDVTWDEVVSVDRTAEVQVGYDLTVPGPQNWMNESGVFVPNTVNISVPHSPRAVGEVQKRMMPSKMLVSVKDFESPVFTPSQDHLLGLYHASRAAKSDKKTKYFGSTDDAVAAFKRGEIDIDTPVVVAK